MAVPAHFRSQSNIAGLNKFKLEQIANRPLRFVVMGSLSAREATS